MLAFWAGTLPALLLAGTSAQGLSRWKNRPGLRRAGGALLIVMGVFSIAAPLQKMMGHEDSKMTLRYINLSIADIAAEFQRAAEEIHKRYKDDE